MTTCYDPSMSEQNDKSLINFIATTVEALRSRVDTISEQMATKDDLVRIESRMEIMRERIDTISSQMATKDELEALRKQLLGLENNMSRLATTVQGDFEQVHFRFDTMERVMSTRFGQVETDISRLRSVLYLLVKDKPDMLRLLGHTTPGESRTQG